MPERSVAGDEAGRGGEVVVGAEGDDEVVGLVGTGVGRHPVPSEEDSYSKYSIMAPRRKESAGNGIGMPSRESPSIFNVSWFLGDGETSK